MAKWVPVVKRVGSGGGVREQAFEGFRTPSLCPAFLCSCTALPLCPALPATGGWTLLKQMECKASAAEASLATLYGGTAANPVFGGSDWGMATLESCKARCLATRGCVAIQWADGRSPEDIAMCFGVWGCAEPTPAATTALFQRLRMICARAAGRKTPDLQTGPLAQGSRWIGRCLSPIRTADNHRRRGGPPPPWTQISQWEKMKLTKGNNDLGHFWYTNLLVPEPPPPSLLIHPRDDRRGGGDFDFENPHRLY